MDKNMANIFDEVDKTLTKPVSIFDEVDAEIAKAPRAKSIFEEVDAEIQDSAITKGFKRLGQGLGYAKEMTAQDYPAAAEEIGQAVEYQQRNPGSPERIRIGEDWRKDDATLGDDTFESAWQGVKNVAGGVVDDVTAQPTLGGKARAAWENTKALGGAVVEQVPNMLPPVAGMLIGGAAGSLTPAPGVGTAVGAFGGATAGNTLVEGQGVALKSLEDAGINPTDREAVAKHLEENAGTLFGQAATKGAIIGLVDTITAGAAGKILTGPARAASERALTSMGVDLANKAAVKLATQTPEFAAKIAGDTAYQASKTGAGNIARNVGAAGLDPLGEFAGEFVGSGVAMDDWNAKEATVEAISSVGQSGLMYAGQKAYQAAKKPLEKEGQQPPPATPTPEERKAAMDAIRQENPTDDDLIKIKANPDLQKQFGITTEDLDLYTAERAEKAQVEVNFAGATDAMKAGAQAAIQAEFDRQLWAGTTATTVNQEDAEAAQFGRDALRQNQERNQPKRQPTAEEIAYGQYNPELPPDRSDPFIDQWADDAVDLQQREDQKRIKNQPLALPPVDRDQAAYQDAPAQGFEMVSPEESAKRVAAENEAAKQRGKSKVDTFFTGLLQNLDQARQEGREPQNPAERKLLGMDPLSFQSFEEAAAPTKDAARQLASRKLAAIEQANYAGYITDEQAAEFEQEVIAQRKAWGTKTVAQGVQKTPNFPMQKGEIVSALNTTQVTGTKGDTERQDGEIVSLVGGGTIPPSFPLATGSYTTPKGKELITISGDTAAHEEAIKSLPDAKWNETRKAWTVAEEHRATLEKRLAGLVERKKQEETADRPSGETVTAPVTAEASAPTEKKAAKYFQSTPTSVTMKLSDVTKREDIPNTPQRQAKKATAIDRMAKSLTGEFPARVPVKVVKRPDGSHKLLDGNTTYHVLQEMGETEIEVEVVKPSQSEKKIKSADDLRAAALVAQPEFDALIEKMAKDSGAVQISSRPGDGLKSVTSIERKVVDEYDGDYHLLVDILGKTLIFEDEQSLKAGIASVLDNQQVMAWKNRWDEPLLSGYQDINISVRMSNGHVAELQMMTRDMYRAKQEYLHSIYEVLRKLEKEKDVDPAVQEQATKELNALMQKGYTRASEDGAIPAAYKTTHQRDSSMALFLSIMADSMKIFNLLASDLISQRFSPTMRKVLSESLSKTLTTLSPSKNTGSFRSDNLASGGDLGIDSSSEGAGGVDPSSTQIIPTEKGEVKEEKPGGAMTVTRSSSSQDAAPEKTKQEPPTLPAAQPAEPTFTDAELSAIDVDLTLFSTGDRSPQRMTAKQALDIIDGDLAIYDKLLNCVGA
jgi:citrate lyase gamma subunit